MKFIFTKKSNSIKEALIFNTHDISDGKDTKQTHFQKFCSFKGHRDWSGSDSSDLLVKSNPPSAGNLFMSSSVYNGTNQYILFLPKTWFNKRKYTNFKSLVVFMSQDFIILRSMESYFINPQESTILFNMITCSKFALRPRS